MTHTHYTLIMLFVAGLVAFAATPLVGKLAAFIGAIDVPQDERRMHKQPIPRLGGLAVFAGFIIAVLGMYALTEQLVMDWTLVWMLIGAVMIVVIGVIDDIKRLTAWVKFPVQVAAALIAVLGGAVIEGFSNPFVDGAFVELGIFAVPISVIWIVGMTNAINFIDGLDGLSVGVSAIGAITIFIVAAMKGNWQIALLMAALVGGTLGFLPYNVNPASMFVGDTGATFLGFVLGAVSIMGLFKFTAIVSFAVPLLILGLPLFDMLFSIVRRIRAGKSPMEADRSHVHHKLIDMGFSQKQSVSILYAVSAVLSIAAVVLAAFDEVRALIFLLAVMAVLGVAAWVIVTLRRNRRL
ncbi:MAG: undecaprenyl/decaprenyl-phosphate alpha-N-acetylglucosaminyl 1-phosphate transferase [Oscillospiraceae bacterium]|nr:undecaprenyl/decaprenyl-phosphate alpha-N-acetylglucosaminyl 1-phosphate transferase [Oscillospiraceae bacterium]